MLLRLGCSMVAWLVVYTHLLWLATLRVINCSSDGDAMWRLLLGFAPVALGFATLLQLSRRLPAVHEILRWAAAPLVLLIPLAIAAILPTLTTSTLGAEAICSEPMQPWHRWWAPLQLFTIGLLCVLAYRAWRPQPSTD